MTTANFRDPLTTPDGGCQQLTPYPRCMPIATAVANSSHNLALCDEVMSMKWEYYTINDSLVFVFFFRGQISNDKRETKRELLRDSTNIETKNKEQTIKRD